MVNNEFIVVRLDFSNQVRELVNGTVGGRK